MPTSPINTWEPSNRLVPLFNAEDAEEIEVALAANLTLAKGTVLGEKLGQNAIQTVGISGTPTGGTFTLAYAGQTTASIAYNATAAQVQSALEALSTIGVGNVSVAGGPGPGTAWVVTFQNALGFQVINAMTHADSFTGGSSPAASVTQTNAGSAGTKGTYAPYVYNNTDGTQFPKVILAYACSTDGSGNVTLTGEWGATVKAAPAFMRGYFATQDLVGLDQNAVNLLGGSLIQGTVANGIVRIS